MFDDGDGLLKCDFNLNMTIDEFSRKRSKSFYYFSKMLKDTNIWERVAEAAVDRRVLASSRLHEIRMSTDPNVTLVNELNSKNCTVKLLCECMLGHGLQNLFQVLGIEVKLFVVKQPGEVDGAITSLLSGEINLEFNVEGIPYPSYQWYHNEQILPGAVDSSIILSNFNQEKEGFYHCVATQTGKQFPTHSVESNKVECILLATPPDFTVNLPPEIVCNEGDDVTLYVQPQQDFIGTYEWMFYDQIIVSSKKVRNKLSIRRVGRYQQGHYRCIIRNSAGEKWSDLCHLKVSMPIRPSVKLALLIGNFEYSSGFSSLSTPRGDVMHLTECLRQIGFVVQSFLNLTLQNFKVNLQRFISCIPEDSFVFFFFSGHGFEIANNKFFLPIDCPPNSEYTLDDCVPLPFITSEIIKKKPLLLVNVLDMCLTVPDKESNSKVYCDNVVGYEYDVSINNTCLIEACATSDYQFAYEKKKANDGLYTRCLCRHLRKDINVEQVFLSAHKDFGDENKQAQSPQIKVNYHKNDLKLTMKPKCQYTLS